MVINDYGTQREDGSWNYSLNPQQIPIGQFSLNEARSNGHSGVQMYYHRQAPKRNVLNNLLLVKNREYGLLLHDSGHTSLVNSLLAENAYNIEMRWSDDVEIRDTEIRGISSHTRYLVHPPYYN